MSARTRRARTANADQIPPPPLPAAPQPEIKRARLIEISVPDPVDSEAAQPEGATLGLDRATADRLMARLQAEERETDGERTAEPTSTGLRAMVKGGALPPSAKPTAQKANAALGADDPMRVSVRRKFAELFGGDELASRVESAMCSMHGSDKAEYRERCERGSVLPRCAWLTAEVLRQVPRPAAEHEAERPTRRGRQVRHRHARVSVHYEHKGASAGARSESVAHAARARRSWRPRRSRRSALRWSRRRCKSACWAARRRRQRCAKQSPLGPLSRR
jgi:hypothetical protein